MINKTSNKKKHMRLFWLLFLLASAAVLAGGVTYSRYAFDWSPGRTAAQAKAFYFTSDFLTEGDPAVYQISDFDPGTGSDKGEIIFELRNYADELRISHADIQYEISAVDAAGASVFGSDSAPNGTLVFGDGKSGVKVPVSIKIPASCFVSRKAEITVTAKATSPYSQTLAAVFELYQHNTDVTYTVSDSENSNTLILTVTASAAGTTQIIWSDGLLPDRTNTKLQDFAERSCNINANSNAQYTITFFKTDPAKVYTVENFIVK